MSNTPRGFSQNQISMSRTNQHNFNMGFQPSQNLIPQQDFTNNGNLIHNNVAQNVFNESMFDNMLHIDSYDRDVSGFPNPFSFTVSLGGAGTSREKVYDRDTKTYKIVNYSGVPSPRIQKNFTNVKQIILDKIFFPQYIVYTRSLIGGEYVYNGLSTISSKYRYLILKIRELDNNRVYSTNDRVGDDSFILYKDKDLGGSSTEIWLSSFCRRTFLKSALKNLDKLTVQIVDPDGNQLKIKYINDGDATETEYDMPVSELTGTNQQRYEFVIHMTVTTIENDLSTNVNYR
jgi:hypothetical protein